MTKKSFNDSFKEGMGGEIGKRTGTLVFGIILAVIAAVFGIKSCSVSDSPIPTINKSNTHSNTSD